MLTAITIWFNVRPLPGRPSDYSRTAKALIGVLTLFSYIAAMLTDLALIRWLWG